VNLLLVEDDTAFADALAAELREFDHAVTVVGDGRAALQAVDRDQYDAVVLDWKLPQVDGMFVLQRLRSENVTVPVIMLSALGRPVDKVEGLDSGADDYVVKPVAGEELNARLHAVLRGRGWTSTNGDTVRAGDIVVSPGTFRAWRDDQPLDLATLEFNLLAELARNAGSVLTRSMLLERVWHYDFEPTTNVVDAYICRLRAKLTAQGGPDPIVTKRGVGYMLRA
jgi:DNA-binding response OmpR family regulator